MDHITAIPTKKYSYPDFFNLTEEQVKDVAHSHHHDVLKLNLQRMKRNEKQVNVEDDFKPFLSHNPEWLWVVIAEPWCGDGAQTIPIINKIAELYKGIEFKMILRDENPEIMDKYVTNGIRSMPKLICFDKESGKELGLWGPRPKTLNDHINKIKSENPGICSDELKKWIHLWYAKDKGESVKNEFLILFQEWLQKK
jgi:thiol-disulfide isomerase/thioredoxin